MMPRNAFRLARCVAGEESGQTLVFFAVGIVFIFAMLAVTTETGFIYMQRRDLTNAADAAALAGAQELNPADTGSAQLADQAAAAAAASARAQANVSGVVIDAGTGITFLQTAVANDTINVVVHKTATTVFGGWFSLIPPDVQAHARAQVRSVSSSGVGASPLTITQADYTAAVSSGNLVCLKLSQSDKCPPGTSDIYNIVQFDTNGAKSASQFLAGGVGSGGIVDDNTTTPGLQIPVIPGNKTSLNDGLYTRLDAAGLSPHVKTSLPDANPALAPRSPHCLAWSDVVDSGGKVTAYCNPLIGASMGASPNYPNTQPTSVLLIPIAQSFNGNQDITVATDAAGFYEFAFFFIDPSTYSGANPTCGISGQCAIVGKFVQANDVATVTSGSEGSGFDPFAGAKVVRLIQ